jgi:hypothetical protein
MSQRNMRRIHKWVAIAAGIFLLSWTVSGVAMLLPARLPAPAGPARPSAPKVPVDFRDATLSPAEAIARLEAVLGEPVQVDWVSLGRIRGTAVYMITAGEDGLRLIDATSGGVFELTQEVAEQLAREEFPTTAPIVRADKIEVNDLNYPWGALPAYRFVFADAWGTVSTVASTDGTVFRSDVWTRLRHPIVELHSFEPLTALTGRARLTRVAMIGVGSIAVFVALTGYYLAIPWRKRRSNGNR